MLTQHQIDQNNEIDAQRFPNEPCGCPACDNGVRPGHFACEQSAAHMLQWEQDGQVVRSFDDGRWKWYIV